MLAALNYLNSCATIVCETDNNIEFPYAGIKVAEELQYLSFNEYPNLWEWMARINKLRQELEYINNN